MRTFVANTDVRVDEQLQKSRYPYSHHKIVLDLGQTKIWKEERGKRRKESTNDWATGLGERGEK